MNQKLHLDLERMRARLAERKGREHIVCCMWCACMITTNTVSEQPRTNGTVQVYVLV